MSDEDVVREDDDLEDQAAEDEATRDEDEYVPQHVLDGGRDYRVAGNDTSGYIGVDPEYMTYANPGERPILTDAEKWDYTNQLDHLEGNMDSEGDGEVSDTTADDEEVGSPVVVTDAEPVVTDEVVVTDETKDDKPDDKPPSSPSLFGTIS